MTSTASRIWYPKPCWKAVHQPFTPEDGKKAKIVFDKEIRVTRKERDWRWMA